MKRAHNFSAGPAILPVSVLEETQQAVIDFNGTGMSIMEVSHRSPAFDVVIKEAQADCLKIMGLSADDYSVLFLGGGASTQFTMLAQNFLKSEADYVNTGAWAKKSMKEAKMFGKVNEVGTSEEAVYNYIPKDIKWNDNVDYAHYTTNNTIYGTEWKDIPTVGKNVRLIADMSSDMFAREMDWSKFDMIYAGAQKNIGPAGVVLVVVKNDWIAEAKTDAPTMMQYKTHSTKESMFNTPPTLPIFVVGRTFKWILAQGGLKAVEANNIKKAAVLYDMIDSNSDFYKGTVLDKNDRSLMNVTWNLPTPELEAKFVKEAKEKYNMTNLKGHRSVGGVRASIYNACPMESVEALATFMQEFMDANK